jgi:hypothetical protein
MFDGSVPVSQGKSYPFEGKHQGNFLLTTPDCLRVQAQVFVLVSQGKPRSFS